MRRCGVKGRRVDDDHQSPDGQKQQHKENRTRRDGPLTPAPHCRGSRGAHRGPAGPVVMPRTVLRRLFLVLFLLLPFFAHGQGRNAHGPDVPCPGND